MGQQITNGLEAVRDAHYRLAMAREPIMAAVARCATELRQMAWDRPQRSESPLDAEGWTYLAISSDMAQTWGRWCLTWQRCNLVNGRPDSVAAEHRVIDLGWPETLQVYRALPRFLAELAAAAHYARAEVPADD